MVAIAPREERRPSLETIAGWNAQLEGADPDTIIRFAVEHFGHSLAVATQFGAEGITLLHRVAAVSHDVRFFTIDTGLMFQETIELSHRVEDALGIQIERIRPRQTLAEQALMRRVFDIDVLQCPRCDSQMQRIAFITKPEPS